MIIESILRPVNLEFGNAVTVKLENLTHNKYADGEDVDVLNAEFVTNQLDGHSQRDVYKVTIEKIEQE